MAPLLVWKTRGCTSTPRVATYFFSNSPVKWRFTKVVFPVPPSPTSTSLKVGMSSPVAILAAGLGVSEMTQDLQHLVDLRKSLVAIY